MPTISRFYGILIRMYVDDHPPPHFHAVYQGDVAVLSISTANWERIEVPEQPLPIAPLS